MTTTLDIESCNNDVSESLFTPAFNDDISAMVREIASEIDDEYKQPKCSHISLSFVPKQNHVNDISEIFKYQKLLGSGASCSVSLVTDKHSKQYALKQMPISKLNRLLFTTEYKILNKLNGYKNILSYHSCFIDKKCYYLSTEYHSGGTMLERILEKGSFCESECAEFIKNVLLGLQHMHNNNIVHRDIKCENLIFDKKGKDGIVKIIDFGNSETITNPQQIDNKLIGSFHYLPPELLRSKKRTKATLFKSDMWALGVVSYILLTGKSPFYGKNQKEMLKSIKSGRFSWPKNVNLSVSCKHFICSLLCLDIDKRLDCNGALTHEWIAKKGKALNIDFGNDYFNQLEIFSKTNKLQKVLINAILSEMEEQDKKMLLIALRDLNMNGNDEVDQNDAVNYLLMNAQIEKQEIIKTDLEDIDIERILLEIDELDAEVDEKWVTNNCGNTFTYLMDNSYYNIEQELLRSPPVNDYGLTPSNSSDTVVTIPDSFLSTKISIERFEKIMDGSEKKYDVDSLVASLNPTESGNILFSNINVYDGPMHSVHVASKKNNGFKE